MKKTQNRRTSDSKVSRSFLRRAESGTKKASYLSRRKSNVIKYPAEIINVFPSSEIGEIVQINRGNLHGIRSGQRLIIFTDLEDIEIKGIARVLSTNRNSASLRLLQPSSHFGIGKPCIGDKVKPV